MSGRRSHPLVLLGAAAGFALLLLPLLAVAVYSVNSARTGFVFEGFTLRWYGELYADPTIREAAANTLVLAVASTAISTVLGTALALALDRFPWPKRAARALDTIVDLPVVSPDIVFAAALVVAFALLAELSDFFRPGMGTMVIGHVTFEMSFVALVVRSRLALVGPRLAEAAHDLSAGPVTVFRRVTLPLLAPGIAAGAVLAFALSLDDFVISFFTAGPRSGTLPILIYSSVRRGLSPKLHALSTLIVLVTVLLALLLARSPRRTPD